MKYFRIIFPFLILIFVFSGCQTESCDGRLAVIGKGKEKKAKQFPGTPEGAKALLSQFLVPDADKAALSKKLRPSSKDFEAVFVGESAKKAEKGYREPWEKGQIVIGGKLGQTELLIWGATTEELKKGSGDAKAFPGGYVRVAPHLKDGLTFYRFKFVRPGESLGFAWDGLVFVNGHWAIFPKPWRVLR